MRKTTSKFATFLDQKYIPLDNKIKIAIAVVLVIIPIALFYFLYFQPSSEKIATLTQQNDKLSQEIKALENKKRNLPKLQKEIAAVEERFEEAKNAAERSGDSATAQGYLSPRPECRSGLSVFYPET